MTTFLVLKGFDRHEVLDMDHVSFTAMHDQVMRMSIEDSARELEISAVAAQGDSKGIKNTLANLRKAAGTAPEEKRDLDKLRKLLSGGGRK